MIKAGEGLQGAAESLRQGNDEMEAALKIAEALLREIQNESCPWDGKQKISYEMLLELTTKFHAVALQLNRDLEAELRKMYIDFSDFMDNDESIKKLGG